MGKKEIVVKNGIVGLIGQLIGQILQFFIRKYILKYIGVEILGISSTLNSVISTLSLAELGFQQAVVYYLYKPLKQGDKQKINDILNVLKRVYLVIGAAFIAGALGVGMFLDIILKVITVNLSIYLFYFIICFNMAMTYFLSYRRALLYADQREYISQIIDSICNILMCGVKIFVICQYKNFVFYLLLQVLQTGISNTIINHYCKTKYVYLADVKFNWKIFKAISRDVKDVFMAKIAGFVYGATDNLIISGFVGAIYVGYLSNYTIFTNALKQVVNSVFNSMTSIIGNMLNESSDLSGQEKKFRIYAYFRYLLATVIVVPWGVLSNNLVQIFFGPEYIMQESISILIAIDLYIHIVYSLCCEYISGSGLFRFDRNISIIGAVINIAASVIFVFRIGVIGVLVGTVISQIFFWIARSAVVYGRIFHAGGLQYLDYIIENSLWILGIFGSVCISRYTNHLFEQTGLIMESMIMLIVCEFVNLAIQGVILIVSGKRYIFVKFMRNCKR